MRCLLGTLVVLLAGCSVAGCSVTVPGSPVQPSDADLVSAYFNAFDAAGDKGSAAQSAFFQVTQHPDFKNLQCDLGGITIDAQPALSSLRPDQGWTLQSGVHPRGTVYVVAVLLTVRKDDQTLGTQIGSQRVVVLDGSVYGFMPCPR